MTRLLSLAALLLAALALDGLATWTLIAAPLPARLGALGWMLGAAAVAVASLALLRGLRGRALGVAAGLVVASLLSLGSCAWRYGGEAWRLLSHAPQGIQAESLEGGRVLRLSGPLAPGDASRLQPLLAAAQRVEISSSGGSPGDALALAAQIAERPRMLLLRGPCTRDCALLFLASPQRLAVAGAYLGLQHLRTPSWNPLWQRWLDARLAKPYADLSELQQRRLRLTPPPVLALLEGVELETVLSRPANPLQLLLPPQPATRDDLLLALQTHAVWPALEQRFPGSMEVLADGLSALPDDAARQQLAWAAQRRQARQLEAEAVPVVRLQAMELQAEQMRALSNDADCRALGADSAAVRAKLPAELQLRELHWLRDTARDLQRDAPLLKPLEREMLFIVLGRTRLQAIDRLRSGALGCAESQALLDTLLALPTAQRRLAAKRWAFAPSEERPMKRLLPLLAALSLSAAAQAVKPEVVVSGLDSPWAFAALPDGGWLVTERPGELRRVTADGKLLPPLTGVPDVVHGGQGGLHDLVLDRDFAKNRQLYLCYAEAGEGNTNGTALAKASLKADGSGLEAVQVLFRQLPKRAGQHHFGCRIAEAADGTLYLSLGDRFRGMQQAQTLDNHLGKIVRVGKDGKAPADNPFVGQAGALPEIWSLGHRNSQGLHIDAAGQLWETEHGPQGGDELNRIQRGRNYGWPVITYGENYGGGKIGEGITAKDGMEQPVQQWTPSIALSGLVRLTSDAYGAAWKGSFFMGSLKFRYLERLQLQEGKPAVREKLAEGVGRVRDVRQGPDGLIYLLTEGENGQLIRLKP